MPRCQGPCCPCCQADGGIAARDNGSLFSRFLQGDAGIHTAPTALSSITIHPDIAAKLVKKHGKPAHGPAFLAVSILYRAPQPEAGDNTQPPAGNAIPQPFWAAQGNSRRTTSATVMEQSPGLLRVSPVLLAHLAGLVHLLLKILQLQLQVRHTGTLLSLITEQQLRLNDSSTRHRAGTASQRTVMLDPTADWLGKAPRLSVHSRCMWLALEALGKATATVQRRSTRVTRYLYRCVSTCPPVSPTSQYR